MTGLVAAYTLAWVGFLSFLYLAHQYSYFPVDFEIARDLQAHASPWLTAAMKVITAIGYFQVGAVLIAGAALTALFLRWWVEASLVMLSPLGGLLDEGAKRLGHRNRPEPTQLNVDAHLNGYSFPSGHAAFATYFLGLLIVILLVRAPDNLARRISIGILALLILLVGISRVYLGEHWPSDILGGYWLGALWLVLLIGVYQLARRRAGASLNPA